METTVFLVSRPGAFIPNVIVEAVSREFAKSHASYVLGGNPDEYVVNPVTKAGERTLFLVGGYQR